MIHAHAAGALHQGFDDDRGDLGGVPPQQTLHVRELAQRSSLPGLAGLAVVAVRRRRRQHVHEQRLVQGLVQSTLPTASAPSVSP